MNPIGNAGASDDLLLSLPPAPATLRLYCDGRERVNVELELAALPLLACDENPSGKAWVGLNPDWAGVKPILLTGLCGVVPYVIESGAIGEITFSPRGV